MTSIDTQVTRAAFFSPIGAHVTNASLAAAVTLTPPTGASILLIQTLTQNVRLRLDGTAPTSSTGFQLKAGDPPTEIGVGVGTVIKVIEETASASIEYQWGH